MKPGKNEKEEMMIEASLAINSLARSDVIIVAEKLLESIRAKEMDRRPLSPEWVMSRDQYLNIRKQLNKQKAFLQTSR